MPFLQLIGVSGSYCTICIDGFFSRVLFQMTFQISSSLPSRDKSNTEMACQNIVNYFNGICIFCG